MKFLNFGSLNLDFVYDVEHFVRPGETISSAALNTFSGGKGLNQSVALSRAGAQTYHGGCIGKDGQILLDGLRAAGADVSFVRVLKSCRTGHAIIQVDPSGQNCILLFGGANQAVTDVQIEETLSRFGAGDFLLLQNETNGLEQLMEKAAEKGIRIAFNPSPIDGKISQLPLEKVEFFLLNEIEGASLGGGNRPEEILEGLKKRYPKAKIVLTLGKEGALYFDGEKTFFQPIFPVKAMDTTAAGDTFTGYFLEAVSRGLPGDVCLKRAAAASAIAVSRKGASPSIPDGAEVDAFLAEQK